MRRTIFVLYFSDDILQNELMARLSNEISEGYEFHFPYDLDIARTFLAKDTCKVVMTDSVELYELAIQHDQHRRRVFLLSGNLLNADYIARRLSEIILEMQQ